MAADLISDDMQQDNPRPDIPPGQLFVIGDSHIGLGVGAEERIVAWLDRLRVFEPRELHLNGDVFHYFIGEDKFVTPPVTRFFDKLRELRDSGIGVYYIEGNRDFFLKGSVAEPAVTAIVDHSVIEAGGRSYYLVHGDMINDRDYQYRLWRRASKNPLTRIGVKLFPRALARGFVNRVEEHLSQTNFKHKYQLPTEQMQIYGSRRLAEGHDIVVFGHFHEKLVLEEKGSTVVVLPAWFESEEAMVISPDTGEFQFVRV